MATIPSIAMIPSGYKADKVYSVLPTNGDGDFTFARTSVATRVNNNGLIEEAGVNVPRLDYSDGSCPSLLLEPTSTNLIQYSEAFANGYWTKSGSSVQGDPSTAGAEQVTNGDFATDSDWSKGTGWAISGGSLNASSATANAFQQNTGLVVGRTYKVTYTISNYVSGSVRIELGSANVSVGLTRSANGTYTEYIEALGDETIYFDGISAFTASIDNVSVKEVQGFASPSANSPLGAFKLVEDTSTGEHRFYTNTTSVVTGTKHTHSIRVKPNGRDWIKVATNASDFVYFNISTGVVGSSGSATGIIKSLNNGWVECSITFTTTITQEGLFFNCASSDGSAIYTGNGTSGVYIFGAQLEQQSYATSYIKTEGTVITRAADTATGSGDATVINSTEGVFYFEGSYPITANGSGNKRIAISDGTSGNRVMLAEVGNTGVDALITSGGLNSSYITSTIDNLLNFKIAISYKQNDFALWVNGIKTVGVPTNGGNTPIGLNQLVFNGGDGGNPFYGKTKDVRVYTTALSDLEIETLSSWTSFTAMANALKYTII